MATGATPDRRWARSALDVIAPGSTTGIGSLPHRSASQAAEFALGAHDVPAIPSLPRRSPAEAAIAQALAGAAGVTLGPHGVLDVDVARLDPDAPVATDLAGDGFVGFRTFLQHAAAAGHTGPVKWQFAGPISAGATLLRAGAAPELAFGVAVAVVRSRLRALSCAVACALPESPQLVIVDEPLAEVVMDGDFPISPGEAADLLSAAMAAVEPSATVGVHVCRDVDIATVLEAGPQVLSVPASKRLVPLAGYLDRFVRNGGWIAWGAVATAGPIGVTANRSWHQLASLWCDLMHGGADPMLLRERCLLTPECGLGTHSPVVAERVCHSLHDVARLLRGEMTVARFALGG